MDGSDNIPSEEMDEFQKLVQIRGLEQPWEEPWWQARAYQLVGFDQISRSPRCILSMDKGMGKTSLVLALGEHFGNKWDQDHPTTKWTCIILTTKRGITAYTRDIEKFPEHRSKIQIVHAPNDVRARKKQWRNTEARYFITTWATFLSDCGYRTNNRKTLTKSAAIAPEWVLKSQFDALFGDEFHRVLRNRGGATFDQLKAMTKDTPMLVLLSGSAVSKGPEDLWAALHILDRKMWSSYWNYVGTWCEIEEGQFGRRINGPRLDPDKMGGIDHERVARWRAAVKPYVFHVTADMVPNELPAINNYPLDVRMEPWQEQLEQDLRKQMWAQAPDGQFIMSSSTLANVYRIRLALICPKVLNPEYGYGAGIEAIADDIEESTLRSAAIFTPFRDPIPHLRQYLEGRGFKVWVLWGGISVEMQDKFLNEWRRHVRQGQTNNQPGIILSTVKYAESWEIPECKDGYFLGYEWDPEDNDQARKRMRRISSTKDPIRIQWVRHLGAYDETFLQMLMDKTGGKRAMMDPWSYFKRA